MVLVVLTSGCYTATLVTLTPAPASAVALSGGQRRITDADVQKARQIAGEIAEHFGFTEDTLAWGEQAKEEHHQLFQDTIFSVYGLGPLGISLHLPDDRSHLDVAINDLSHASGRAEIVRVLQADFKRMFEEAFPDYEVEAK